MYKVINFTIQLVAEVQNLKYLLKNKRMIEENKEDEYPLKTRKYKKKAKKEENNTKIKSL